MEKKIGFWYLFSLVTGSQIGSGIFIIPSQLAPIGQLAVFGWILSGFGAICLALVFGKLCNWLPKNGGPYLFTKEAFGNQIAFLVGWIYWIASWSSTGVVILAGMNYLNPIFGPFTEIEMLFYEISALSLITWLNLKGIYYAGRAEFIFTILKFSSISTLALIFLLFFDKTNMAINFSDIKNSGVEQLKAATQVTFWGFIGLEAGSIPADEIKNASKTIPKAIFFGTFAVSILYFISTLSVIGVLPQIILVNSKAPYVDATSQIFGGYWHYATASIAVLVCIGSLNSWILSCGQMVLTLAKENLTPKAFATINNQGAPSSALKLNSSAILVVIFLSHANISANPISDFMDFTVLLFIIVYIFCCLAFLVLCFKKMRFNIIEITYTTISILFCIFMMQNINKMEFCIILVIAIMSIPAALINTRLKSFR